MAEKKKNRTGDIALGLLGATAADSAGRLAAGQFAKLMERSRAGEQFVSPGWRDGDVIYGPPLENLLAQDDPNPLVLDRTKWNAERKRLGVNVEGLAYSEDRGGPHGVSLSGTDAPTAFHELGHAAHGGGILTKLRQHTQSREDGLLSVGDGLRAGFLIGAIAHPENKAGKFVHDNAALLTGLTEIPALMDELRASYSALKGLNTVGGKAAVKGGLRTLAPALATYLAGAAGHVGAVALARHMAGGHEKTAADAPGAAPGAAPAGGAPTGGGGAKAPTLGVPKMPAQPKVTGALRLSSIAANATPIGQLKPKTTPPHPGNRRGNFPGIATAKPPSLTGYYRDTLDSMDAPSRGTRT